MDNGNSILKFEEISKSFPGVKALSGICLEARPGEVHAIVGENGAGKSTLMNILSGVYPPDEGKIFIRNREVRFKDPRHAQQEGIAMIHQELSLAPSISIMENIFAGRLKKSRLGFVDYKAIYKDSLEALARIGAMHLDPREIVKNLSVSEMQLVEIAKALSLNAQIIIMDEPTSSLTTAETRVLLSIIGNLRSAGISILYISHRLEEVKEISDRVTVLRDGQHIQTVNTSEIEICDMVALMVGRSFDKTFKRDSCVASNETVPILEVRNLSSGTKLKNISFQLKKGEILGLTGLIGAGRTELVQAIFGRDKIDSGEIFFEGKKVIITSPTKAIKLGMGLVPEGRKTQGLFMKMTVRENISVVRLPRLSRLTFLKKGEERRCAEKFKDKLRIKTTSIDQRVQFLSGGNQQKCIIARWLLNEPKILFLDEPTHGVDVGAKAEIYEIINQLAKDGVSVILISSELPEVLMLSDRIAIMHNGTITGVLDRNEATQENIMAYSTNQMQCM